MFDLSLHQANVIFTIANITLVLGGALVLVGTIAVFWTGGIRERFADERISNNESDTEKAKAEAATANEAAAKANESAARSRLEQERLKQQMAWRRISQEQHRSLVSSLKGHPITVWLAFIGNDPESITFRADIDKTLKEAGIVTKYFSGLEMAVGLRITDVPGPDHDLLVGAFRKAGVPIAPADNKQLFPGQLTIVVGSKPPPF